MSKKIIPWEGARPELASEMSLRDYFAAAAFTNYALHYQGRMDADEIASECYSLADAMLAERAKRKEAQP